MPGTFAVSLATMVKPTLSSRSAKLTSAVTVASSGSVVLALRPARVHRAEEAGGIADGEQLFGVGARAVVAAHRLGLC